MHKLNSEYQLDTLYRVGIKKVDFITQLDTMYRVCVHSVAYTHQLDTLYRVDIQKSVNAIITRYKVSIY